MLQPIGTAEEAIKTLGGTSAVGRLTKSNPSAVSSWKRTPRSRIPAKYYPVFKDALAELGYFAPLDLFSFADDPQRKSA
jgi:hypothetical protein